MLVGSASRWLTEEGFNETLSLCQSLPGQHRHVRSSQALGSAGPLGAVAAGERLVWRRDHRPSLGASGAVAALPHLSNAINRHRRGRRRWLGRHAAPHGGATAAPALVIAAPYRPLASSAWASCAFPCPM